MTCSAALDTFVLYDTSERTSGLVASAEAGGLVIHDDARCTHVLSLGEIP
jgi:hypothetical protein